MAFTEVGYPNGYNIHVDTVHSHLMNRVSIRERELKTRKIGMMSYIA
jgi:uncharacterized C2H2 Zn-finger protein